MFSTVRVSVAGLALASVAYAAISGIEADGQGGVVIKADADGVESADTIEWFRTPDEDTTTQNPFHTQPIEDPSIIDALNNGESVSLTPPDGCGPGYCFLKIGESYSPKIASSDIAGGLNVEEDDDDENDDTTDDDDDDPLSDVRDEFLDDEEDDLDALDDDDDDDDDDTTDDTTDDDTDDTTDDDDDATTDDDDDDGDATEVETPDDSAAGSVVVSSVAVLCSVVVATLL